MILVHFISLIAKVTTIFYLWNWQISQTFEVKQITFTEASGLLLILAFSKGLSLTEFPESTNDTDDLKISLYQIVFCGIITILNYILSLC